MATKKDTKKATEKTPKTTEKAPALKSAVETKAVIAKEPEQKQSIWSRLLYCLGLCAWAFIATIAAQYLVAYPMTWILGQKILLPVWTTVYNAIVYLVSLALTLLVPAYLQKRKQARKAKKTHVKTLPEPKNSLHLSREELGLKGWPTFTDIGLAPIAFFVYLVAAYFITSFASNVSPWFDANEAQNVGYSNLTPGIDRVVAFIALVIIAPIAEEIIFRGWLYGKLRSKLSLIPAVALVSILFGVLHGQWNVGINVGVMSIFLCLLREITGTVYSGIILHMIKNGIAFYLLYIMYVH